MDTANEKSLSSLSGLQDPDYAALLIEPQKRQGDIVLLPQV